jgi:hypothetical protein
MWYSKALEGFTNLRLRLLRAPEEAFRTFYENSFD